MFLIDMAAVAPIPPTPPEATNIWEYVIILLLSGSGIYGFKQIVDIYKEWSEARRNKSKQIEVDKDTVVEKVVLMLQTQIDDQVDDFNARLDSKDRYYEGEIKRREKYMEDTLARNQKTIVDLQEENRRLRREISAYQQKFGYIRNNPSKDQNS